MSAAIDKRRWLAGLLILVGYVAGIGILSGVMVNSSAAADGTGLETLLPQTSLGLIRLAVTELLIFGSAFLLFWFLTRARKEELLLEWRGGAGPVARGLLYSILLRVFVAIVVALIAAVVAGAIGNSEQFVAKLRPKTEVLVDAKTIGADPVYLFLAMTLISFVVAGLREELWRSGVILALGRLYPAVFGSRVGQGLAVAAAAVVFGLGHLAQGWGGAFVTGVLGLGLGYIMVRHQSIWEAVLAHGFFNASTFALLYLLANYYPEMLKTIGGQ